MDSRQDRNEKKFAEPRGWAAKWCGYGLFQSQTPLSHAKGNEGGNGKKFAEPRGWAAKWCGGGLFGKRDRQ